MTRTLKTLGVALIAVLAMSAMVASAAQAAKFTASAGAGTKLSGTQTGGGHVFSAAGQTVTCTTASFAGTATGTEATTQTITPTYSGCTAFGFIGATVTGFGAGECDYLFNANGKVDLTCAAGKSVVIDAGPCTVTIKSFTGKGTNTFTNGATDVTVDTNVTGIEYEVHKGFLCPASGSTTELRKDGTYTGTTTLTAGSGSISWDA